MTQSIRDLCRDARNLALVPRAELLLYVAREIQLVEEIVAAGAVARRRRHRRPLPVHGRGAGAARPRPARGDDPPDHRRARRAACGPTWSCLVDVDPSVARGRRKVAKIWPREQRPASRKGLAGSGLRAAAARGLPGARRRAIQIAGSSSTTPTPISTSMVASICDTILQARTPGRSAGGRGRARAARRRAPSRRPRPSAAAMTRRAEAALAAFLGWVDDRAQARADAGRLRAGGPGGPRHRRSAARAGAARAAGDRARAARSVRRRVVAAPRGRCSRLRPTRSPCRSTSRPPRRRRPGRCASCSRRSPRRGREQPAAAGRRDRLGAARAALRSRARRRAGVAGAARRRRGPGACASAGFASAAALDAAVARLSRARGRRARGHRPRR